eukprot:2992404-Pyramimonas_sp.AAC.1
MVSQLLQSFCSPTSLRGAEVLSETPECRKVTTRAGRKRRGGERGKRFQCQANFLSNMLPGRKQSGLNKGTRINVGTEDRPLLGTPPLPFMRVFCADFAHGMRHMELGQPIAVGLREYRRAGRKVGGGDSYGTGKLEGQAEILLGKFSARR